VASEEKGGSGARHSGADHSDVESSGGAHTGMSSRAAGIVTRFQMQMIQRQEFTGTRIGVRFRV
jgi:hypothetical protein